jgi:hypothetical protein
VNTPSDQIPHRIDVFVQGRWITQDRADNLEEAVMLASAICDSVPEDCVRIVEEGEDS